MFLRAVLLLAFVSLVGCQAQEADPLLSYENQSAEKIYKQAKEFDQNGDTKKSAEAYSALRAFHPESSLVRKSLSESIKVNMSSKNYEDVVAAADKIINWYPATGLAGEAYYFKGKALLAKHVSWFQKNLGVSYSDLSRENLLKARHAFFHVTKEYPSSKYYSESKKQIKIITRYLAEHQLHIAKYYFRKKHYLAAVERAKLAISIDKEISPDANKIIVLSKRMAGRGADW